MDQKCKLMFLAAAVAFAAAGAEWKILEPAASSPAYAVAAREFQKYYEAVTGTSLSVIAEPAASDHLVVIGSDSVNRFANRRGKQNHPSVGCRRRHGWLPDQVCRKGRAALSL
ncbi:MAG: hypothetical protein PHE10_09920, partial [Kiritimatiellae bacterium]|nr:hypothetical protein [Kiritimatiellia bacterium]